MRVLRISHSAVVDAWRERERAMIRRGIDVSLISAAVWDEGGQPVTFHERGPAFAGAARTFGSHPNLFLYDPRPIWRALARGAWDVIDIHEEPCSLATTEVLLLAALRRVRAPVVLYSAQNIDKRYPLPFRWFERRALRRCAGVSVCNTEAGHILRGKGLRSEAALVPLGVDVEKFSPARRDAPHARLRVGYVGRLATHKGVDVLLDAMAQLPDCEAELVGAGPAEPSLHARAERLGISERVRFHGHADDSALADLYRGFDILVVPSLPTPSWLEQFCRVAVEAMASGVPVIASRSGALPDVVGDAGVLVPPGDVDALRDALADLAADPERWRSLRAASLQHANGYTWDVVAAKQHQLYQHAVGRPVQQERPLPGIDVVVVAYGEPGLVERCLAPLGGEFPLIVVDNSSSPVTRKIVENLGGTYIDPGRNLGFAGGVNRALAGRHTGHDVLLLNPDAAISAADILALQRTMRADPALGCVAPAQVDPVGRGQARVGWPFPSPAGAWIEAAGFARLRRHIGFVIGAVLLLRVEAVEAVGGFDEQFFLYAEETDWQWRADRAGWGVAVVPDVTATHEGAGTGGDPRRRERHFHASHELFVRKHYGAVGWQLFRVAAVAGAAVRAIVLPGERRRRAAFRLRLYVRGPVRAQRRILSGET